MYREVTCWNTGNTYLVTNTENLPVGMRWYSREEDGYYTPRYNKTSYKINKTTTKPSIYKRDWFQCRKDEYKYAFTERTTRVTTTDKDVYYNDRKDRFISKSKVSNDFTVEYGLPYTAQLIVW